MVDEEVLSHVNLSADDVALLKKLAGDLPILADIWRADLLLYCRMGAEQAVTVAQAMPHSVPSLHEEDRVGLRVSSSQQPEVLRGFGRTPTLGQVHTIALRGAAVARQVFPVRNAERRLIAVLVVDSNWFAYERHRHRSKAFQDGLRDFQVMVLRGGLRGAETLGPFGEYDGILYVGADQRIQYMSGIASGLYRHLGYRENLVGQHMSELEVVDQQMITQVLAEQRCLERQVEQRGLTWIRRALPVSCPDETFFGYFSRRMHAGRPLRFHPHGVFILIHDATRTLETQRELESKMAMIREVHHRVKNNLQVIASLMRMQARRVVGAEARTALEESVNRILSVAVVHEFLSQNAKGMINLQEVAHRIVIQLQQSLIDPSKRIELTVLGSAIWLPAERATQCALVINELVQNAIEHGMARRDEGHVQVELVDRGDRVSIIVTDDGEGLPEGFGLDTSSNLGLRIVRSMVERDLRGEFELQSDRGKLTSWVGEGRPCTAAIVHFSKSLMGGN